MGISELGVFFCEGCFCSSLFMVLFLFSFGGERCIFNSNLMRCGGVDFG